MMKIIYNLFILACLYLVSFSNLCSILLCNSLSIKSFLSNYKLSHISRYLIFITHISVNYILEYKILLLGIKLFIFSMDLFSLIYLFVLFKAFYIFKQISSNFLLHITRLSLGYVQRFYGFFIENYRIIS